MENSIQQLSDSFRRVIREEITLLLNERFENGLTITQTQPVEIQPRSIISSKFGWLSGLNTLIKLHATLLSYSLITCEFSDFNIHFIGTDPATIFLVWHSDLKQLVYLFSRLRELGFIPENKNPHKILSEHFINKNHKELSPGCLRSSLNDVRNSKNNYKVKVIEDIIASLNKT